MHPAPGSVMPGPGASLDVAGKGTQIPLGVRVLAPVMVVPDRGTDRIRKTARVQHRIPEIVVESVRKISVIAEAVATESAPEALTGPMSVMMAASGSHLLAGQMVAAAIHACGPSIAPPAVAAAAMMPVAMSAVVPATVPAVVSATVPAAGIDRGPRHGQRGQGQDRNATELHRVFTQSTHGLPPSREPNRRRLLGMVECREDTRGTPPHPTLLLRPRSARSLSCQFKIFSVSGMR
jgi:hypothetical protein